MTELQSDLDNRVSGVVGRDVGISGIPTIQWFFMSIFLTVSLPFIITNPGFGIILFCSFCVAWFTLTGNDPNSFIERFGQPIHYISAEPYLETNAAGIPMPEKIARDPTYTVNGKPRKMSYIEKRYEFLTYVQMNMDCSGGAYLLQKQQNLMFIFVWEVMDGDDPSATHQEAMSRIESARRCFPQLPFDVDLKGHEECIQDASVYIDSMRQLLKDVNLNTLERHLIKSRIEKATQMEEHGSTAPMLFRRSFIAAKFKVPLGTKTEYKRNVIERELYKFGMVLGLGNRKGTVDRWAETIELAYNTAFKPVQTLLESHAGLGLKVRAMDVHEIHERDWYELHNSEVPAIPHYMLFDNNGLSGPYYNYDIPLHNHTFVPEQGQPVIPEFGDDVIYFPAKGKYAGFLRIDKPYGSFPEHSTVNGPSKALGMYRYLHNRTTRYGNGNPIRDYRIVWEVARDDSGIERISLDRNISSSVKRASEAHVKGTRDVPAEERELEAVEARRKLRQNDPPCHFALGVWLYRDSIAELNHDLKSLAGEFAAARTERVFFKIHQYWEQTWLFEGSLFLTKPHYRCQKLLSSEVIPQVPRIFAPKLDSKGVLFLNKELRVPTYLDICDVVPNHTAILGITGAGKSLLMSEIILEALIKNNPVVVFDFPRPDGTSTYRDMVYLLQACGKKAYYYDVRQPINAIECIDLSSFLDENGNKGKNYQVRYETMISDHIELLTILILGSEPLPGEERDYAPEIAKMYREFLAQPHIQERQAIASKAGFGNPGYELMPTIKADLYPFIAGELTNNIEGWASRKMRECPDPKSVQIYSDIARRMGGRLDTKLGHSIKGPSSFDIDCDFLVVALTEVKADDESLIFANSGLNILTRKAMLSYAATCIVDEGTTLFKLKQFAKKISDYPPTARKYGSNFVLGAQVIEPIVASGYSSTIFGNMINKIMGYCSKSIYQEMISDEIGMRPEIAAKYMSEDYKANLQRGESYWYLMRANKHVELTFSVSDLLLAMNSNDVKEVQARDRFKAKYSNPDDPADIQWLLDYSKVYAKACRNKISFDRILPDVVVEQREEVAA
jgi:hypothetical protein